MNIFTGSFLTPHECQRRLPQAYPDALEVKFNSSVYAFFDLEEMSFIYKIIEQYLQICYGRWNVDMNILDYNLAR